MSKTLSVIIPCHNESGSLPELIERLKALNLSLDDIRLDVIFVDDGSTDSTLQILRSAYQDISWLSIIELTRNYGKESALTAGLDNAHGDAVVFMDADLQHPPEIINNFIEEWKAGASMVIGKRNNRSDDSPIYRKLAVLFYRLHNKISDITIPPDAGDFRLIDRPVADHLRQLREYSRFMKGLYAWLGYDAVYVKYDVAPRVTGTSKYGSWKSWNFALDGITSFSTVPLRFWTYIGLAAMLLGLIYSAILIIGVALFGIIVPGYVTLLVSIVMFGGVQLIGIGVLGEYIGRIFMEVKGRPLYLVKRIERKNK